MKIGIISLLVFYSFNIFANVIMKIDLDIDGNNTSTIQNIELDKKYVIQLNQRKMEYIVSGKKPTDNPADNLWGKNSIYLTAKIYDSRGNIISSPKVMTVLGQMAQIEQFDSKNSSSPSIRVGFTASNH